MDLVQIELITKYTIIETMINSVKDINHHLLNILNQSWNTLSVTSIKNIIGNTANTLLNIWKSIMFSHIILSNHSITTIVKKYMVISKDIFALCKR